MPTTAKLQNPLMDAILNKVPTSIAPALKQALTALSFSPMAGFNLPKTPLASPITNKLVSPQGDIVSPSFFDNIKQQAQPIYDAEAKMKDLVMRMGGKGK